MHINISKPRYGAQDYYYFKFWGYTLKDNALRLSNFLSENKLGSLVLTVISIFMKCAWVPLSRSFGSKEAVSSLISRTCRGYIQYGLSIERDCFADKKSRGLVTFRRHKSSIYLNDSKILLRDPFCLIWLIFG
jgi:hypothetical protein